MREFIEYIKYPRYVRTTKLSTAYFFRLWFYLLLIAIPLSICINILKTFINTQEIDSNSSTLVEFLSIVILGPLVEELLFRLILKPRHKNLLILLLTLIYLAVIAIIKHNLFSLLFVIFAVFILIILSKRNNIRLLQRFFISKFSYIYYISAFFFGVVHVFNYSDRSFIFFITSPIIIIPMMILGAFYGFVRIKYGIIYSILLHSFYNFIPAIIMLLDII